MIKDWDRESQKYSVLQVSEVRDNFRKLLLLNPDS